MINFFLQAAYRKSKEDVEKAKAAKANGLKKQEVSLTVAVNVHTKLSYPAFLLK